MPDHPNIGRDPEPKKSLPDTPLTFVIPFYLNTCPHCGHEFVLLGISHYEDENGDYQIQWFHQTLGGPHMDTFCPYCGKLFRKE